MVHVQSSKHLTESKESASKTTCVFFANNIGGRYGKKIKYTATQLV